MVRKDILSLLLVIMSFSSVGAFADGPENNFKNQFGLDFLNGKAKPTGAFADRFGLDYLKGKIVPAVKNNEFMDRFGLNYLNAGTKAGAVAEDGVALSARLAQAGKNVLAAVAKMGEDSNAAVMFVMPLVKLEYEAKLSSRQRQNLGNVEKLCGSSVSEALLFKMVEVKDSALKDEKCKNAVQLFRHGEDEWAFNRAATGDEPFISSLPNKPEYPSVMTTGPQQTAEPSSTVQAL